MAAPELITQVAPPTSLRGPFPYQDYERKFPEIVDLYHKERKQQHLHWSGPSTIRTIPALPHRCNENRSHHRTKEETPMSHEQNSKRQSSKSSPNEGFSEAPPFHSRDLPPIQSNEAPAAVQNAPQSTQSVHSISMRPTPPPSSTPPDQRISRPIGVENLLNPAAGGNSTASNRHHDAQKTDSPQIAPSAGMSRPATPSYPSTTGRKNSVGDITLPSITPPLMNTYPQPVPRAMTPRSPTSYRPGPMTTGLPTATIDARQSPFVGPRDQASTATGPGSSFPADMGTAPNILSTTYTNAPPPFRSSPRLRQTSLSGHNLSTYPRMQTLLDPPASMISTQFTASRSSSPSVHHRTPPPTSVNHTAPTGQPQSFFSAPFTSAGPASTMPQLAFDKKASVATGPMGHSQYQMMTLETESGPIQVPVDVQAASKVADEKRKRNATASHRFRQRRKEKEQETSNSIAKLEAQVREMAEEKEFYQRERDFLQDVIHRNRVPVPPRPTSPRRRRHASLGGPSMQQYQESEVSARDEGRNTRRRTSAYVPPQGPPPTTVEPPPAIPFERLNALPSEHLQGLQQRMRQPGPFHPNANPFDPSAPR